MSNILNRIKNIINSNINFGKKIESPQYEDFDNSYYSDSQDVPKDNKEDEYYKILELEYGASFNQIKSAYRRLLKKYHPDLYQNDLKKLELAKEVTKKINEAYTYFERKCLWIYTKDYLR